MVGKVTAMKTLTYFSQHFGAASTSKSMTMSPREVSSKTLMVFQALAVKFWVCRRSQCASRDLSSRNRDHVEIEMSNPPTLGNNRIKILQNNFDSVRFSIYARILAFYEKSKLRVSRSAAVSWGNTPSHCGRLGLNLPNSYSKNSTLYS
jgi:hypothetical protein